ncbi:MAG: putative transcriptional regulatory protein [Nevskia sp.]|nr:putative transcriptional regulatory protein [Nevskia sp.]
MKQSSDRVSRESLKVLWVDDDQELTADLAAYLGTEGYEIETAPDLESARHKLASAVYDLVIVDIGLPDGSGLTLVKQTPRTQAREFVVLTGQGSLKSAVEAMRYQVFDYLMKPLELDELRNVLTRVRSGKTAVAASPERVQQAPARRKRAEAPPPPTAPIDTVAGLLIGNSPAMQHAQALVARASGSDITVLIQGESGTGKEIAARCLHQLSRRVDGPFVALNCAAVTPTLIASELFGHEKGAFTGAHRQHKGIFERAAGGTLFLDEITEMPIDLQATLLRVLETGLVMRVGGDTEIPVDVRMIAATNRNPVADVENGRLRLDLYYRLQVFPIELPPLRDRGTDVLLLAEHFLQHFSTGTELQTPRSFVTSASADLLQHDWPGNVRELRNVVERACLLGSEMIEAEHLLLPQRIQRSNAEDAAPRAIAPNFKSPTASVRLRDAEYDLIMQTLTACRGNKTRAAAELGISVKTLYNKLKRFEAEGLRATASGV